MQNSDTYGDTEIEALNRLTGALVWSQLGGGTYWELGLAADGMVYIDGSGGGSNAWPINGDTGADVSVEGNNIGGSTPAIDGT